MYTLFCTRFIKYKTAIFMPWVSTRQKYTYCIVYANTIYIVTIYQKYSDYISV
jgi:hypothetical protein